MHVSLMTENMADNLRSAEEGRANEEQETASSQADKKNMHLYNVLGIEKKATDEDIKKAYRKLALRYHPDKNIDGDPDKTEKFKEVNYANTILSNPTKRKVYDEMGETGLKMMEQFGDDEKILRWMLKPWFKWLFFVFGLVTCGFCFCCCGCMCCCQCCCNFCCGKYKPANQEDGSFDDVNDDHNNGGEPITVQPSADSNSTSRPPQNQEEPSRPAVIAMGPPS